MLARKVPDNLPPGTEYTELQKRASLHLPTQKKEHLSKHWPPSTISHCNFPSLAFPIFKLLSFA